MLVLQILCSIAAAILNSKANAQETVDETQQLAANSLLRQNASPYLIAYRQSLGFFNNINDHDWALMKKRVHDVYPNVGPYKNPYLVWKPAAFYTGFYHPDFTCLHERRIGRTGDGGKWICDPHRIAQQTTCLVYSVGSNNDFSFENAIIKEIGPHCEIHTFDFTDYSANAPKNVDHHYHVYGISHENNDKFKTLPTVVQELEHEGKIIDIFKIDCEGCEWQIYESLLKANVLLRQITIELHDIVKPATLDFFARMYQEGYVIFHKEPNIQSHGKAIEYSFLKLDKSFFNFDYESLAKVYKDIEQ